MRMDSYWSRRWRGHGEEAGPAYGAGGGGPHPEAHRVEGDVGGHDDPAAEEAGVPESVTGGGDGGGRVEAHVGAALARRHVACALV